MKDDRFDGCPHLFHFIVVVADALPKKGMVGGRPPGFPKNVSEAAFSRWRHLVEDI